MTYLHPALIPALIFLTQLTGTWTIRYLEVADDDGDGDDPVESPQGPTCQMEGNRPIFFEPSSEQAPKSWKEAISRPVNQDRDCIEYRDEKKDTYDNKLDTGECCCGFWSTGGQDMVLSSDLASNPSCTASYPGHPRLTKKDDNFQCAEVAIAISGSLREKYVFERFFHNIQSMLVDPATQSQLSVHVFAHLSSEKSGLDLGLLTSLPPSVKHIIVEYADKRVDKAIAECTNNMFAELFHEMTQRYASYGGLKDDASKSSAYMYRHMFLAHDMVRNAEQEMACNYKWIMRYRPDFTGVVDWPYLVEELKKGKLLIGASRWLFESRSHGVSHSHRCAVDDQMAIGTPEQMYRYSSVYTDLPEFAKYLPLYRSDFGANTNERILTAHLHYRGLGDEFVDFPHDLRIHGIYWR